jgi:3-methyladenine DNA glycosylase Mpg
VVTTARIGVRGGDQKPWRFVDAASRHLSRPLSRTPILPAG